MLFFYVVFSTFPKRVSSIRHIKENPSHINLLCSFIISLRIMLQQIESSYKQGVSLKNGLLTNSELNRLREIVARKPQKTCVEFAAFY